jgi:hypothetical protein
MKLFRWEGERSKTSLWHVYESKDEDEELLFTSIYRKSQGVGVPPKIPKYPCIRSHMMGIKVIMGGHVELHGAPQPLAGHPLGAPHEGLPWPPSPSRSLLVKALKGGFPKISQKALLLFMKTFFYVR